MTGILHCVILSKDGVEFVAAANESFCNCVLLSSLQSSQSDFTLESIKVLYSGTRENRRITDKCCCLRRNSTHGPFCPVLLQSTDPLASGYN